MTGGAAHGADGPGRIVDGRFELLERLGSGGMGTVWRARDLALEREVALKEVRPPDPALAAADPTASRHLRLRVLREARALARISHPNVVTIHHIVDGAGPAADAAAGAAHPWLVMELLPGRSLQEHLARGPLDFRTAARLGRGVLAGLRAAHAAGIHHRDVKPANVMLRPDGTAVLTDFGIAALAGASPLTLTGEFVGSPEYIAPERVRGAEDAASADLWSLGMLLYVAVEGRSPMRRDSTLATLAAVLDDPVPPPRLAGPLGPVLAGVLVRDPAARPDGARLDALLAAVESGGGAGSGAAAGPTPTVLDGRVPPPPGGGPGVPPPPPGGPDTYPTVPRGAGPDAATPGAGRLPPGHTGEPSTRPRTTGRNRRGVAAVVGAVLALGLVAGGTYVLAGGERDPVAPVLGASGAPAASGSSGSGASPSGTSAGSGASAALPPSPAPAPSTSGTPAEPPPPSTPPSAPPAGPGGTWVAQLHSEPVSTGRRGLDRSLARTRAQVPDARVLLSDDYASLNPGYRVIYAPGPFESGRAALAYCALRGRTTANSCVGRWISDDRADRGYLCRPPASSPRGRCTRD
ncbi:serine/threonine-protein kinase [Streptomyces sp. NPDC088745]|uniref:serine/threonine-protein kinase n=1 Tax=Streptomyces sp. NPDC088745 TaxID=3365884 RepID=UPI0038190CBE